MLPLQISLLGKFCMLFNGVNISHLYSPRVQELFCYLLVHSERPHGREKLAELLWENSPSAVSKRYLRQGLWQFQSVTEKATLGEYQLLLVEPEWVQFNPTNETFLDVWQFEQAFQQTQGIEGPNLCEDSARKLETAIALYHGDLLENWYQDWCILDRERFQNIYMDMLLKMMAYCETHQNFEQGIAYGSTILKFDGACEIAHRRLMRLRYLSGDRTSALRQYDLCVRVLKNELSVQPSQSTKTLYLQILSDSQTLPLLSAHLNPAIQLHSIPDFIKQLERIQEMIATIQQQLQHDIQEVKAIIGDR